jgi:hypothetical protein
MADFGWAFVKGNLLTGSAPPSGAVQFNDGNNKLAASNDLIFISGSTSQLNLTGTLNVSGAINANSYNVTVTNQNVINLTATGSTKFGDTSDDVHRFTGSLNLAGNLSASVNISASAFYGDGSNLSNVTTNPAGANTQIQFNNSSNFGASSNLTFASNTLAVGGDISASVNISASAFYGDGSNLSGITTNPAGSNKQIQFNNSSNFGGSSNFVFDSGKVGIGTDTPSTLLHVKSTDASKPILKIENQQGGSNPVSIQMVRDTNSPADDDAIGQIDFRSKNSTDSEKLYAYITGKSTDVTNGTEDGEIQLYTMDNGTLVPAMTLQSGKVGIGTQDPNHKLTVIGDISASVNVSASAFYGDGSNLTGIAATLDQVTDNGNTTSNALTASALNLTGLSAGTATNTKFLALDSSNNVVLTSSSGGSGGNIGAAEDGSYADGLFSDFLASTPIGTAIDKFNEILKIIVPGPAPAVDRINYTNTNGIAPKLTFTNQGEAPSGYTDVTSTGSFTSPPAINDQYTVATSGEDFRLGVYNGTQEITGVINFHVAEELKSSQINYTNNAFGNAESGSLKLIVNGSTLRTLNLTTAGAGNPNSGSATNLNSNGSGFFNLSITASAKDQNSSLYNIFQHRTSKYVVDPQDQRKGWNIAKIEHEYGSTSYVTNFVQWFNDTDASSNAMSVSNSRVTFTGNGSKYLSGVRYFRSASLVYNADVSNVYKFTYPTGNVVTFNRTSNINAISAQALPATDGTDLFNKVLRLTASTATNDDTMLNNSTTVSVDLSHPFKTNLSTAGSVITSGILIYNVDTANNNLTENFDLEDFRITNGSYTTQGSVTAGAATWSSSNHMTLAAGHTDGLLMYNGALRSPLQGANGGNFSTLANGPAGNPNYSSVEGTRTFFRKIQNTSGSPVRDLKITSTKSTRIDDETLSANNVRFSIKIPETTGWMDISQNFSYGNIADDDGSLINGASDNSQTSEASTNSSVHCITFGTASVAANHYVVIKIQADESWTGNFDTLQFQLGASDVSAPTESQTLDDIDLDDTAGVTAKLSFGSSNAVGGYTNVAGGVGSMSAVNSNAVYTDNGDTNRGVFKVAEVMGGTLNEDVAANGNNYTANSFKNAYTGSLLLIVNDSTASTLSLANLNSTNNLSSNTGFSVGAVAFSTTTDNIPDYTKPYRTGTYSIGTAQQRNGWNYARVIHRIGASDTTTNYVQWVIDPSGNVDNTAVTTPTISNFNHPTTYYQSGIGYFASNPSGTFDFAGSNFYNNVYQSGSAISFPTTTNCSVSNIRVVGTGVTTFDSAVSSCDMPALNNSADCETTSISVTGTMLYNGATPSISGGLGLFTAQDVAVTGKIIHPHKSDKTTNSASKTAFMIHSGTLGSTNLNTNEYFGLETYRIVSGNYANQASVTNGSNAWNPQTHMNAANAHGDGMVTINNKAISPLKIGNDGDTRNVAQGGSLQAPTGNPDYSTLSENVRTYYRYFRNETGLSKPTFTITLYGDANLVAKSGAFYTGALGANKNINVELKVPSDPAFTGLDDTSTAWADCVKPFGAGTQPNVDGVGIFNGGGSDLNQTVASGGRAIALQLQEKQVRDDQYFVVKISAHKDWTGYLSRIAITY